MTSRDERKAFENIRMMERQNKPRTQGVTYARDRGMGLKTLEAALEGCAEYIDILKLAGFAARLQSRDLIRRKVAMCKQAGVEVGLGGALCEIALLQGPAAVIDFLTESLDLGITFIEVCRAVAIVPVSHLLDLTALATEYGLKPIAEVGVAYGISPDEKVFVDETKLIGTMRRFLDAGAHKILLESEGITESRHKEDYRWDVISKIAHTFPLESTMFEADDPEVYTRYIRDYGPEVNLFVDISRVLPLEAARRGGWGMHPIVNRVATFYRPRS